MNCQVQINAVHYEDIPITPPAINNQDSLSDNELCAPLSEDEIRT